MLAPSYAIPSENSEFIKNNQFYIDQLVMLALGSLIGSGWLFGSWEAAAVAGPAAILSWVIGGLIIGIIAYNYIELGTMFLNQAE